MKTLNKWLLASAVVMLLALSLLVTNHIRADAASTYSIWFAETKIPGKISPEVASTIQPEKLKVLQTNQVRLIFEGQKSNGDHVRAVDLAGGYKHRTLQFPQQGIEVLTNTKNNSISTMGSGAPRSMSVATEDCREFGGIEADRKTDTLLGFRTYHILIDKPIVQIQQWIAPDLGCALVKSITIRKSDGATNIVEATKISTDPPDDALFKIPEGAIEMKPSDYWLSVNPPDPGHKDSDAATAQSIALDKLHDTFQAKRDGH
jgi:hypothetical protein